MSGLYNPNFSPARAASPQIRSTPDVDSQYLSELLAEHQKLGPFMQILPICSRLLNQEIFRVSGMMSNQGFGDFDRLRHRSPSPMASSNLISNVGGTGLGGWNGLPQEVIAAFVVKFSFHFSTLIFGSRLNLVFDCHSCLYFW
ncbi:hypothetical protein OIU78_001654 [Salix suchowensis]|uniref:RNA-BINDING PROTEIN RELATED n=1 Tax=Salix koriyanagi TaxID=2511006 RepID=A0A9Q0ZME5_9ROSI|nr:hypothetical protein OIU78_001654 [Salix suchowensis]KAJ6739753.1 RNA-BINDING PROTEIN RELATED [Salix koriyanagi]